MKSFLLFLNVLVFACLVLLFMALIKHRSPPAPVILTARPERPSVSPTGLLVRHDATKSAKPAAITEGDLFNPNRGVAEASASEKVAAVTDAQRKKLEQLELLGIVRMGALQGAIIHDRAGKLKKKFFKVDDQDDIEGFNLVSVNPDANTATLGAGGRQYDLKLERSGKGGEQRRAQIKRQDAIVTLDGKTPAAAGAPAVPADPKAIQEEQQRLSQEQRRLMERQRALAQARARMAQQQREAQQRQANPGQPPQPTMTTTRTADGRQQHVIQLPSPPPAK